MRARPEAPVVIINHPRGRTNYFGYVGYDPRDRHGGSRGAWNTKFTLLEVFNDSSWLQNRNGTVAGWVGLLKAGRKMFAIGSSDSHDMSSCIELGTDDPRPLTGNLVRDRLAVGRATVSGGSSPLRSAKAAPAPPRRAPVAGDAGCCRHDQHLPANARRAARIMPREFTIAGGIGVDPRVARSTVLRSIHGRGYDAAS